MPEFSLRQVLKQIAEAGGLELKVKRHECGIEADLYYSGARRKGVQVYTEEDGEETLVDVLCRGSTLYQNTVRLDWEIGEKLRQKIAESLGVELSSSFSTEIEFTCDLEDAYYRLKGTGEMADHDYIVMGSKNPEEMAVAASSLATETGETVLLAYNGFGLTVFPGQDASQIRKFITRD